MRKASRRLTQLYDEALAPCDLRSTQYAILAELARRMKAPPTMQDLADALVMDRSSLGHNVRPLERDGFLTIRASNDDRRRRLVELTTEGQVKYREGRALWQKAQRRFLDVYGESDATHLRTTLLEIAHNERLGVLAD
jgi:DNA-binding MarR family transcriptional regulator